MPLFDAYVVVDWSASAAPRRGRNSIWIRYESPGRSRLLNPPTRRQALVALENLFDHLRREGLRTLAGFDFAFGYPAGFAQMVACRDWRDVWGLLARQVVEGPRNRNRRFAAAAELNRRITGSRGPFWGCPPTAEQSTLGRRKADASFAGLPQLRLTETRVKGPKSVFQLLGAGAVGSQTLTGVAALNRLRFRSRISRDCRVWPFETGLRAPSEPGITLAEVYPSLVATPSTCNEIPDAAQVRALARWFRSRDRTGSLARYFQGPSSAVSSNASRITREEGWILGVT